MRDGHDKPEKVAHVERRLHLFERFQRGVGEAFHAALLAAVDWALRRLTHDSNLVQHAEEELRKQLSLPTDDADRWMADHLLRMIRVFSAEGHSGFSAGVARSMFARLAVYEPLSPLTGDPGEWNSVGETNDGWPLYQNRRCSTVFMEGEPPDGKAYDIEGRVFREPNGICFTSADSRVDVVFPYVPRREYVDVDEGGRPVPEVHRREA